MTFYKNIEQQVYRTLFQIHNLLLKKCKKILKNAFCLSVYDFQQVIFLQNHQVMKRLLDKILFNFVLKILTLMTDLSSVVKAKREVY
jgi:hypothetical protein